jgi:hypothetical protein
LAVVVVVGDFGATVTVVVEVDGTVTVVVEVDGTVTVVVEVEGATVLVVVELANAPPPRLAQLTEKPTMTVATTSNPRRDREKLLMQISSSLDFVLSRAELPKISAG